MISRFYRRGFFDSLALAQNDMLLRRGFFDSLALAQNDAGVLFTAGDEGGDEIFQERVLTGQALEGVDGLVGEGGDHFSCPL